MKPGLSAVRALTGLIFVVTFVVAIGEWLQRFEQIIRVSFADMSSFLLVGSAAARLSASSLVQDILVVDWHRR